MTICGGVYLAKLSSFVACLIERIDSVELDHQKIVACDEMLERAMEWTETTFMLA